MPSRGVTAIMSDRSTGQPPSTHASASKHLEPQNYVVLAGVSRVLHVKQHLPKPSAQSSTLTPRQSLVEANFKALQYSMDASGLMPWRRYLWTG